MSLLVARRGTPRLQRNPASPTKCVVAFLQTSSRCLRYIIARVTARSRSLPHKPPAPVDRPTRLRGGPAMNSRLRRSLVLTTLLALLLGPAAPVGLARSPTDTRVAGIDVDATTIPELQELMDAHRLKS